MPGFEPRLQSDSGDMCGFHGQGFTPVLSVVLWIRRALGSTLPQLGHLRGIFGHDLVLPKPDGLANPDFVNRPVGHVRHVRNIS